MNELSRRSTNAASAPTGGAVKRVTSESLLGQRREVLIVHNGREYLLRFTQSDKQILTA